MTETLKPVKPALREVSRSVPRLEGVQKVTGSVEYIHHLRLPGMLYGKIVRSTVAHANIVSIDAAAARELPGVHAVITGEDVLKVVPSPYYGPAFHDQPVLAIGKVHHVGEPVAVVLATDPHVAEDGADLVVVEYDELEPVFDEVAAAQPGAPIVHEELQPAGTFADLKHLKGKKHTNIALDAQVRHRARVRAGRPHLRGYVQVGPSDAHAARAVRVVGRNPQRQRADDPYGLAEPVVRAHGSRAFAGLARE
jgi:CO/xanthine dehydrogenase Mo-binding subunit